MSESGSKSRLLPLSRRPDPPDVRVRAVYRPPGGPAWLKYPAFALLALLLIVDSEPVRFPYKLLAVDFLTAAIMALLLRALSGSVARTIRRRGTGSATVQVPGRIPGLPRIPHGRIRGWGTVKVATGAASLVFFGLWLLRWFNPALADPLVETTIRDRTFLHAGAFTAFVTFTMYLSSLTSWWHLLDLTPGRMVFLLYGLSSLVGGFLLILPWSLQPGQSVELIDAFFTSVSAFAVTGLTTVNVPETFSLWGQTLILLMIQLGGLGIVVITAGLAVLTRNRLSLSHSLMGRTLYDLPEIGGVFTFIWRVTAFTVLAEAVGAVLIYGLLPASLENRAFHALFHAVSAFCNAGFSTFPDSLDVPGLAAMKTVVAFLIILGGIGFPVLFEILQRFRVGIARAPVFGTLVDRFTGIFSRKRRHGDWPRFQRRALSGNAYLTLIVTGTLWVGGAIGIFALETLDPSAPAPLLDPFTRFGEALFYSVSTRTAGFNLTPPDAYGFGAQLLFAFLMVVGGSPVSTAGGIKTTTAGVILVSTLNFIQGHRWIQFRKREIPLAVLQRCVTVMVLYTVAMVAAIWLLVVIEPHEPWQLTFEVISALSTVGLSLGITADLTLPSKVIVIGLMLAGRLGLVTLVYIGLGKITEQRFHYASDRFYVG